MLAGVFVAKPRAGRGVGREDLSGGVGFEAMFGDGVEQWRLFGSGCEMADRDGGTGLNLCFAAVTATCEGLPVPGIAAPEEGVFGVAAGFAEG
ncbi:hypothetical protein [Gluconobacter oxydans]|uniref:hypothetical protein n=1 Tax=Gluconobacter oxydans TaxID=442 RepID=UPI0039EC2B45